MSTVSIIVPVYNVESYLRRCVDSILAQTFTDFELILVDDGSPDGCSAICDEYADRDSRIRVIHKTNGGVSSARNAGIDIASGTYCLFCDSDDHVEPDWCEQLVHGIMLRPDAFVVSNLWRANASSAKPCKPVSGEIEQVSYFKLYEYGVSAYVWNKIYRTDILREHDLQFDENCRFAEDVEFNVRYCACCKECVFICKPLYYYVDNSESIMNTFREDLFTRHLPLYRCRLPLISEDELASYCDLWLYQFLRLFDNVFDPRCKMGFLEKMRYNHQMIRSEEVTHCLEYATGKKESLLFMWVLRTRNYYVFWLFNQLINLKQKLRRK